VIGCVLFPAEHQTHASPTGKDEDVRDGGNNWRHDEGSALAELNRLLNGQCEDTERTATAVAKRISVKPDPSDRRHGPMTIFSPADIGTAQSHKGRMTASKTAVAGASDWGTTGSAHAQSGGGLRVSE